MIDLESIYGISWKERENNKREKEKMGAKPSKEEDGAKELVDMKHPHNWQAIMNEANPPIESLSKDLLRRLQEGEGEGVFLKQNKKYWLDKDLQNCFMLFARGLAIQWSDEKNCWQWEVLKDIRATEIEVARLLDVGWLEVSGNFMTSNLSPGVPYEVAFEVKMDKKSYGWNAPVTLKIVGPDGETQKREEKLEGKPEEQWIKLVVGDFVNPSERSGVVEFSLSEYKSSGRKKGIIIKGVTIQPKK